MVELTNEQAGYFARNRRRRKRRRELNDAGFGDMSGDSSERLTLHPITDPKVDPITEEP